MTPNDIITWLRDQAIRAPTDVLKRGMVQAAATLERLRSNLKTAVDQRNEYQAKYFAVKEQNAAMAAELKNAGGCGTCKNCRVEWNHEPCNSCRQDPNFPYWEWNKHQNIRKEG